MTGRRKDGQAAARGHARYRATALASSFVLVLALVLALAGPALAAQDAVEQARRLRLAGRPDEALALLAPALERSPDDADLGGLVGMLLVDAGRLEDAARLAQRHDGYDGDSFRMHAFLGRQRLIAGDPEAAIGACRRALELKPDAVEPSVCLVQSLLALRRARPAQRAAAALEQLAPAWGRRLGAQALLLQAQKMREAGQESLPRAIPVLREALAMDPEDRMIKETLVETLIDTIHVEEARRLVQEFFPGDEHLALRHYLIGRSLDVMTEIEAAEREYRAAVQADPGCERALLELAHLAVDEEAWDEAVAWLDRVPADSTGAARALILRGMVEDGVGRPEQARRAWEEALALSPENAKARYLLGRLLVRDGEVERGMELLAVQTGEDP